MEVEEYQVMCERCCQNDYTRTDFGIIAKNWSIFPKSATDNINQIYGVLNENLNDVNQESKTLQKGT